jgi:hypothetical protein
MATRPTVKLPTVKLPTVKLPTVKLPTVKLPTGTVPSLPAVDERVIAAVRDAAYVTVGLGVLAVQQTEARRKELVQAIADRFETNKAQVEELFSSVEAQLRTVEAQLRKVETQVRDLVGRAA